MIYHHQFLIHGLDFPQTNITMKPQVLPRRASSKFFYKTDRYRKQSITALTVESWNKIQKPLKSFLLNDLSPIKLKQLSLIFISNHISNSFDHAKI